MDQLMDAYVDWREACAFVSDTYRSWATASEPSASVAFIRYRAALDEEEDAAEHYARLVRLVSHLFAIDRPRSLELHPPGP